MPTCSSANLFQTLHTDQLIDFTLLYGIKGVTYDNLFDPLKIIVIIYRYVALSTIV